MNFRSMAVLTLLLFLCVGAVLVYPPWTARRRWGERESLGFVGFEWVFRGEPSAPADFGGAERHGAERLWQGGHEFGILWEIVLIELAIVLTAYGFLVRRVRKKRLV